MLTCFSMFSLLAACLQPAVEFVVCLVCKQPGISLLYGMIDWSLPHYKLFMEYPDLQQAPTYALPEPFSFVAYRDESDIDSWIDIELSSGDIREHREAQMQFERYFGPFMDSLSKRMWFAVDTKTGRKVATASAGTRTAPFDNAISGELQWVAVRQGYQGLGLSKPMVCQAMRTLVELGYARAWLQTQTRSWLACKVYADLGWQRRYGANREPFELGWSIVDEQLRKLRSRRSE